MTPSDTPPLDLRLARSRDRFDRLERPGDDFPFYRGQPHPISGWGWAFVMGMVLLGFAALVAPLPWSASPFGQFIPAILFPVIPLAALAAVAPGHWTALFRRVEARDVRWMVIFAVLCMAMSAVAGVVVAFGYGARANPAISTLGTLSGAERVLFMLKTLPQLFGEELLTLLPFLALLQLLSVKAGVGRKPAIVLAWLGSALIFSAAHLPTYGWNVVQCFVVIGTARLCLTLPYVMTKNIWVATGAHILNDWTLFGLVMLMGGPARP